MASFVSISPIIWLVKYSTQLDAQKPVDIFLCLNPPLSAHERENVKDRGKNSLNSEVTNFKLTFVS